LKPEWWGSPLVQEKYQEEKACDKRHPYNNNKFLQAYFLNKQVKSSLHAAVVKADDTCTPLDLVHAILFTGRISHFL